MKQYNFSLKSTVIVMILIALLFAVMTGFNYYFTGEMLAEKAQMDSKHDVRLMTTQVEGVLKEVETAVLSVKTHYSYDNIGTRDLKKYLREITEENDQMVSAHGVYFVPTAGSNGEKYSIISYSVSGKSTVPMDSPDNFIDNIVKSGSNETGLFWSEPFLHPDVNELTIACVSPANFILHDSMLTRGFLVSTIRLKWLEKLISTGNMVNASSVLVLSRDGKPVASSGNEYNYKDDIFTIAKTTKNAEILDLGSKMKSGKSGFMEMKNFGFKGTSYVSYQPISHSGWSVAAGIAKSELFSGLYFTSVLLIITAVFVLILVFWLQMNNARKVIQPLKTIIAAVKRIGSEKAGVAMPKIHKPLILAELTDAISTMQVDFQHYVNSFGRRPKEPENNTINAPNALQTNKIRVSLLRNDLESFSSSRNFDMAAIFKMAEGGYGNFYDYFMVNNHTLCFCLGDVKGKGLPASLFMTRAITLFRTGNYFNEPLGRVVTAINHQLSLQNPDGLTITCFIGLLNLENSELIFCNASHPYPYLIKGGDLFEAHGTHGTPLAEVAGQTYKTGKLKIEQGDKLVLFTEGIMEANNDQGDIFGKDWFEDVLRDSSNLPLTQMTEFINKELISFIGNAPQHKDITLFVIRAGKAQPAEQ